MGCEVIQLFFSFVFYYFIHLFILPDSKISLSQELMAEGPDIVKLISGKERKGKYTKISKNTPGLVWQLLVLSKIIVI